MKKYWLAAPILAACTGTIGPTGNGSGTGNGLSGTGKTSEAKGSGNGLTGNDPSSGTSGLAYAMPRLTNAQYLNSLHDLFPSLSFANPDLPTETAVDGFTNAASSQTVAALNIEDYANAAESVAGQVRAQSADILGCRPASATQETDCLSSFLSTFGKRLYRRPLSDEETSRLLAFFQSQRSESDFPTAASAVVQVMLQSPAFLYRIETGGGPVGQGALQLSPYELASRLAFFLTDSPPDAALMAAADSGALLETDEIARQTQRLLATDRAKAMVASFHRQWLKLFKIVGASKDSTAFPGFSSNVANALADATNRFVSYAFWQLDSLEGLLTDSHAFVTDRIAPYFGVPAPGSKDPTLVSLDPNQRAGILTQPGLLAGLANALNDSPVQRGVLVLNSFLCTTLAAPPKGVNTTPPDYDPKKPTTTRQRMETQHAVGDCAGCHKIIDGVGFAFENFDAVGGWRTSESGLPVDAATQVFGTDIDGSVGGAVELASKLAQSRQVSDCVAYTWTRYALGLDKSSLDPGAITSVTDSFWNGGRHFSDLFLAITTSPAFQTVKASN